MRSHVGVEVLFVEDRGVVACFDDQATTRVEEGSAFLASKKRLRGHFSFDPCDTDASSPTHKFFGKRRAATAGAAELSVEGIVRDLGCRKLICVELDSKASHFGVERLNGSAGTDELPEGVLTSTHEWKVAQWS